MKEQNPFISYKGPFTPNVLAEIADHISNKLPVARSIARKLHKMFIEMAQNVAYYSSEINEDHIGQNNNPSRVGSILIGEESEFYYMKASNLLKNNEAEAVNSRIDMINSLSHEELRQYKMNQMQMPSSKFGGSNIGLISLILTSRKKLSIEITPVKKGYSNLSLTVKVDKK